MLAAHVVAWSDYCDLTEEIGRLKADKAADAKALWHARNSRAKTVATMVSTARELGLSPASRPRVCAADPAPADHPMEEFLRRREARITARQEEDELAKFIDAGKKSTS